MGELGEAGDLGKPRDLGQRSMRRLSPLCCQRKKDIRVGWDMGHPNGERDQGQ